MTGDVREYVFRTREQWNHGIGFRVHTLPDRGGFRLFTAPAFQSRVTNADQARGVRSLDVDAGGRVLWLQPRDGYFYRIDPGNGRVEPVIPLASADAVASVGRMLQSAGRIWLHDRDGERLLALRPDTFQIIAEIHLPSSVDVTVCRGRLYALEPDRVRVFDAASGQPLSAFRTHTSTSPVAIAAHPRGAWIYVVDRLQRRFLRFAPGGQCHGAVGSFDEVSASFVPELLCVDAAGNLFASDRGSRVHQFAADGGYIGDTGDVGPIDRVSALTIGGDGRLYFGDANGIGILGSEGGVAGRFGRFYSGTLDNSNPDDGWHRLDIVADIAEGGAVDVYYASSDTEALSHRIEAILAERTGAAEKAAAIEKALDGLWRGPHQLRALPNVAAADQPATATLAADPTHSLLFARDTHRYLWLKLVVFGLTPQASASVSELRIYSPRLSYLRYLPAVFQANEPSREFLERYLSVFETVMSGLETTIGRTPELFDPQRTPPGFLDWLAQWLDIAVEEDWPERVKRQLIERAAGLYERKGTPAGLADFIEIVTGQRPTIRESFAANPPYVLGGAVALGTESRLAAPPVEPRPRQQYTRLGADELGTSQIRADATTPADPFVAAHRFTVILSLSPQQYRRHARGLHRVIREQSPAHAAYELRTAYGAGLDADAVVGINWRVVDPQPFELGSSMLGRSICRRNVSYGPELGVDATLVERAECRAGGAALGAGE
jgi:phage tail-like protein